MRQQGFFYEDWRACLMQHYRYVVRIQDVITEPSLREVMLNAGFTLEELDAAFEEQMNAARMAEEEGLNMPEPIVPEPIPAPPPPVIAAVQEDEDDAELWEEDDYDPPAMVNLRMF